MKSPHDMAFLIRFLFFAMLALLGYVYDAASLIGIASYIPMAIHTARPATPATR